MLYKSGGCTDGGKTLLLESVRICLFVISGEKGGVELVIFDNKSFSSGFVLIKGLFFDSISTTKTQVCINLL